MKIAMIMSAAAVMFSIAVRPGAVRATAASDSVQVEPTYLTELLPAAREIPGWKLDGEPLLYDEQNLWEYIDGSAENFLSFKFRRLITQNYISGARKGLKVEIYEHESPLMAYGIYAQMRSPGVALQQIGNEAFADDYSINFWKDHYFVRVAVFEKSDDLAAAMKTFANRISAKMRNAGALPPESCAFAEEGLVPGSTCFLTQGVLGREHFPPAFVAKYRFGDEEAKLYLSSLADSAAARDTLDWYVSKLEKFQTTPQGPNDGYIQGLGKDPYQGDVIAFQFGKWFGVLTGLKDPAERGGEIVKKTVEKLGKIK